MQNLKVLLSAASLIDVGVDWFTSTAVDGPTARLMLLSADRILSQEQRRGFYVKPWTMSGYSGWKCGRLQFGERPDGAIVRLTSDLAASEWWTIYQITGRCTRIDLQATLLLGSEVNDAIEAMVKSVLRFYQGRSDGPKVTKWSDNQGGATVYLGSRQSLLFFRGYNKGAQSGLDEFEGALRLELEVKSDAATLVIGRMLSSETVHSGILSELASYLHDRGISTNLAFASPRSYHERHLMVNDEVTSLNWLRRQIRPSVQRLIERGLVDEVLDALGLPCSST